MLRIFTLLILLVFGFASCTSETDSTDIIFENDPLQNQHLIHSFSNQYHNFELYSRDSILFEGYNELLFRIRDKEDKYLSYVDLEWEASSTDLVSSPKTEIKQSTENPEVYTSFLIFPTNASKKEWKLAISYKIQSSTYQIEANLDVSQPNLNRTTLKERTGKDNKDYLLALSSPYLPINGYNNCAILVYEKTETNTYQLAKDLNIQVWTSLGDHAYDDLTDLFYRVNLDRYQGRIELIDYGAWQLNLVVQDKENQIILGEEKSADNPMSSLHFPLIVKGNKN